MEGPFDNGLEHGVFKYYVDEKLTKTIVYDCGVKTNEYWNHYFLKL